MQVAFTVLLVGVLIASVASFLAIGAVQVRRSRALARAAHEMGLRFSADDPFDMARRYGRFALFARGHSARAHNVTYGRRDSCHVREFDFRYEAGHGTRRLSRRCEAVVLEVGLGLSDVLMWHDAGEQAAPLFLSGLEDRIGPWRYRGGEESARAISEACGRFAEAGFSIELNAGDLLLWADGARSGSAERLDCAVEAVAILRRRAAPPGEALAEGDFLDGEVETPPSA